MGDNYTRTAVLQLALSATFHEHPDFHLVKALSLLLWLKMTPLAIAPAKLAWL
jgi:hypothetical protein